MCICRWALFFLLYIGSSASHCQPALISYNLSVFSKKLRLSAGTSDGVNLELKELFRLSPATPSVRPLSPKKATEILTRLINEAIWLQGEPWASPKREQWTSTARAVLERAFQESPSIIQRFETADTFAFNSNTSDEEMRQMANSALEAAVAILRSGVDQLSW